MKIGIQTYGSRGDINPWIALGQGLAGAGHEVTLYYTNYTGGSFEQYSRPGLHIQSTRSLNPDSGAYEKIDSRKLYNLDIISLTDYMVKDIFDCFEQEMILAGELLCNNSDLIINNPNLYHTSSLAEKYNITRVNVLVECQFSPNNRVSQYSDTHINNYFLDRVNQFRLKLMLPAVTNVRAEIFNSGQLNLLAYSRIFSSDEDSWGDEYKLCGYLRLDDEGAPLLENLLTDFLRSGTAPIFFSMGSLTFFEGKGYDILDIFLEAISLSGCRAVIQADWSKIERPLPENSESIFFIGYAPHEGILPLCAGVVHHGGAGTTHTALLTACPSVVIAYAWDQFYWGKELQRLGACAALLKRKNLDALQLAGAIRQLLVDPEYKENSLKAKLAMKRERGVKSAIRLIETIMSSIK